MMQPEEERRRFEVLMRGMVPADRAVALRRRLSSLGKGRSFRYHEQKYRAEKGSKKGGVASVRLRRHLISGQQQLFEYGPIQRQELEFSSQGFIAERKRWATSRSVVAVNVSENAGEFLSEAGLT